MIPCSLLIRCFVVFIRCFLWCLYRLVVSFAKMQPGGHRSPSIPYVPSVPTGGRSESHFHSVFPVVFVISWLFPLQKSSLAFIASDRNLLRRSRGPLSSVSNRCRFRMKPYLYDVSSQLSVFLVASRVIPVHAFWLPSVRSRSFVGGSDASR